MLVIRVEVLKTLNEMIQTKKDPLKGSNNNPAIENSQQTDVSQEDAIDIPITENTRNSISQKELQAVKRTDMIPVKGIGKEVDETSGRGDGGSI